MPHLVFPAAGDLDSTFDGDGVLSPLPIKANSVEIQPDGKIVIAGSLNLDFALARYNSDGSLDTSFGNAGVVTTDFGAANGAGVNDLVVQPDGKIVAGGFVFHLENSLGGLARYNPDGSLDSSFGNGGTVTTADLCFCRIEALALQNDGKIVAVGNIFYRYNTDGSLDTGFSAAGGGMDVGIQTDEKIVVTRLARHNTDGSLDTSFGSGGVVNADFNVQALVIQLDGKIVVGGTNATSPHDFVLERFNSDGSFDTSFGSGGTVTTDVTGLDDVALDVAMQQDQKLLVVGFMFNGVNREFAMARYNSDGSLDLTFGSGGIVTTDLTPSEDWGSDVALQPDGKIVVVGSLLARFKAFNFPSSTCIFCDDFVDGVLASDWAYLKIWNEAGDILLGISTGKKALAIATPAFLGCSICNVEASMSTAGGIGNRIWLLAWFLDKENTVEVIMKEESGKWVLRQIVGGTVVAKVKAPFPIKPNLFYLVRVNFDGSAFTLIVNGSPLVSMPAFNVPTGTVGFRVKNTAAAFDYIIVD